MLTVGNLEIIKGFMKTIKDTQFRTFYHTRFEKDCLVEIYFLHRIMIFLCEV